MASYAVLKVSRLALIIWSTPSWSGLEPPGACRCPYRGRLSTLRTIADLHARPEETRLAAAAISADTLVARYALGRLVREPVRAAGFELAEIRRLRDDEGTIPEVRALAARLLAMPGH
jgi:hypothetical protein